MSNYKDKTILIWDTGMNTPHTVKLAEDALEVIYYTPWQQDQKYRSFAYGQGLAPNIRKTMHFWNEVKKADLICFLDTGAGDAAKHLREDDKKLVYGGGDAEKFEEYRYKFRQIQKALGLPTPKTEIVKGVTALRAYLKKHPKVIVKINIFRGDFESEKIDKYEISEMWVDEREADFGPFKEEIEFMVEEQIESVEGIAVDGFFNGKNWLWPCMAGFEITASYVGRVYQTSKEMPKPLVEIMGKLQPLLTKADYRGALSIEVRIRDNLYYIHDVNIRFPSPLGNLYTDQIENYSDVIWGCAKGEDVPPKYKNLYTGCLFLSSQHGSDYWVRVVFPERVAFALKLEYACKVGKYYNLVRGQTTVGCFVAGAKSPQSVMNILKGLSEHIDCVDLDDHLDSLRQIDEMIGKARNQGIEF